MSTRFDRGFRLPRQKYSDEQAEYVNWRYLQEYLNYIRKKDIYGTTIVIASSTSDEPQRAHYQCDGQNDNVEIQAALDDLSSTGGEIVLLEGTYNLASNVVGPNSFVRISGKGAIVDCDAGFFAGGGGTYVLEGLELTGGAASIDFIRGDGDFHVSGCWFHDITANYVMGTHVLGDFNRWTVVGNFFDDITLNAGGIAINNSAILVTAEGGSRGADGLFANNVVDTVTKTDFSGNNHWVVYAQSGDPGDLIATGNFIRNISTLDGLAGGIAAAAHNMVDGVMVGGDHAGVDLDDLGDVVITTPADNEVLAFDNGSGDWINQTAAEAGLATAGHTHAIGDLSDVGDGTPTNQNALMGDGDSWESRALVEADISDYDPLADHDTEDHSTALGTAVLGDLGDVGDGTPTDGNLLEGDGDSWESVAPSTIDAAAFGAGASTDGQVLTSDGAGGAAWEDVPAGGTHSLEDHDDVTITTPADNELLAFDSGSSEWINQTPAEAGVLALAGGTMAGDIDLNENDLNNVNQLNGDSNGLIIDGNGGNVVISSDVNLANNDLQNVAEANITSIPAGNLTWSTWSPTVSGFTVGTGSTVARYVQIGDLVIATFVLTFGATSTFTGLLEITLPVAAGAGYVNHKVGGCHIRDGASASYEAAVYINATDEFVVRVLGAAGTYVNYVSISDSVPMTWASGDTLKFTAMYEAS